MCIAPSQEQERAFDTLRCSPPVAHTNEKLVSGATA